LISASSDLTALQERIGVWFKDKALLRTALTHPSYTNEHPGHGLATNERLEFLGDAVLGFVVAEVLYHRYPTMEEGRLTEWRAQLVCGPTLARVSHSLDLGSALLLGRGEETTGGRTREGNLERAYEAMVGAVMLDQGLDVARTFILRTLQPEFQTLERDPALLNPKGALQQLVQGELGRPHYVTTAESGPDHDREFTVEVRIDGEVVGAGTAHSKQQAEKDAALQAIERLRLRFSQHTSIVDEPSGDQPAGI